MNFFKNRTEKKGTADSASKAARQSDGQTPVTLLAIQTDKYDWKALFQEKFLRDGRCIDVVQVGWSDMLVQADSPGMSPTPCLVHLRDGRTIKPDFILVRNEVRGATHTEDWRNALYGFMYAGIPSVNSLNSIYCFLERPIVQAELHAIQKRLGNEQFPVIPQSYFASFRSMMYGSSYPAVLKVGHAHAGFGKLRVADHHDWADVRSVVAMTEGKYCTAEPCIQGDFDVRIQKIGCHYRAYQRINISGDWKTQTGCSVIKEMPSVKETHKLWAEEAAKIFGGLDICTVDVIQDAISGREYILEVNGTSSGLCPEHEEEDNLHIRDLVLEKMNLHLAS